MEYPTATRLLFDAVRQGIEGVMQGCKPVGLFDWQEGQEQSPALKKLRRQLHRLKPSSAKDQAPQEARQQAIVEAPQEYLRGAREILQRAEKTWQGQRQKHPENKNKLLKIEEFINHAQRPINHIERRLIQAETRPPQEKVFSLFEPQPAWLSKGKAGVPVELGLAPWGVEARYQFSLHPRLRQHEVAVDIAVVMVKETPARFPALASCSFEPGFHSTATQRDWAKLVDPVIVPKKGRLSKAQQAQQPAAEVGAGRRQPAAIEAAIQALEVHGLDRCRDRGLAALRRYVALAVVARNSQLVGRYLQRQDQPVEAEPDREAA